jgi:RNA polymerase sigma-70 factor (ECF subfamily)
MSEQLLQLHARLKRYLGRLLKSPEDVEDVAQESFMRVLEAGSRGNIQHPKAYLYRAARNLALNTLARKSHQLVDSIEDMEESDVLMGEASTETDVIARQRFELFCQAAAQLPEQCRNVLILRKVYGFSQQEVAARLGISVSTVEKHLAKGLARSARFMDSREQGAPTRTAKR